MKAHELLSDPKKWIKKLYAVDNTGLVTSSKSPEAVCWCINGALQRCYQDSIVRDEVRRKIAMHLDLNGIDKPHDTIVKWNDAPERTFEDVHNLLKELDV
jgi:hypothetical protein